MSHQVNRFYFFFSYVNSYTCFQHKTTPISEMWHIKVCEMRILTATSIFLAIALWRKFYQTYLGTSKEISKR